MKAILKERNIIKFLMEYFYKKVLVMKFGTKILVLFLSLLLSIVYVQAALAVFGSIDLLPVMKKNIKEAKDITVDIFNKKGQHIGIAHFDEDDALWYFKFPDRKAPYEAKWKGGSAGLVSPFLSNTETAVAGGASLLAIIGGAIAITGSGSDSGSAGGQDVPSCSEINGVYAVNGPKTEDTCSSTTETFVGSSLVQCQNGFLTIQSRAVMTGSYSDAGSARASGTDNLTQPLQTEDEETEDTTDTEDLVLTVFSETFTGLARKGTGGSIVFNGNLVFGYSEQFGTQEVCQTTYSVVFEKQ